MDEVRKPTSGRAAVISLTVLWRPLEGFNIRIDIAASGRRGLVQRAFDQIAGLIEAESSVMAWAVSRCSISLASSCFASSRHQVSSALRGDGNSGVN